MKKKYYFHAASMPLHSVGPWASAHTIALIQQECIKLIKSGSNNIYVT